MSTVIIKNREYDLKFTFNSFKYMKELNLKDIEDFETNPLKIACMLEMMLLGAVNSNPNKVVKESELQEYLEEYFTEETSDVTVLFEELMTLLQESSFFKSLQRK
jgi:hypothetical protein